MNVYDLEGKVEKEITLPSIFNNTFREDLVRRALLAEQSLGYQPQAHDVMAGLRTTALYVGNYKKYRSGRHMGIAIRPRQKLGGGAMGDVRRIPSSTKGRRAHPHHVEKRIVEEINSKEYEKAIISAISGCSQEGKVKEKHRFKGKVPLIVNDKIEGITKTKELMNVFNKLGLSEDLEVSHDPKLREGLRRSGRIRHFRNSVLIVAKDSEKIERAARNIPGVDVCNINNLSIKKLAPGGLPRLSLWSESAVTNIENSLKKAEVSEVGA